MDPALENLLRARQGPMTTELVQRPGEFGLGRVPVRLAPTGTVNSVCGFCATGCRLKVHVDADGAAVNLSPDPHYPVNLGMACPKGWEALAPLGAPDRATTPLLRDAATGRLEPVDWGRALAEFVGRMKGVQSRHGGASVAFLSTGQIPTEEMALLGALFKFGMGGLHCDSNTRQCMATAHVAYKQSFGFDAPPYTYRDFEESDVLVFVGANPAIAHPIMWQRVMRNPHKPEIIIVDPRRTETAMCGTRHVQLKPKGDLWLFYGIAHEIIARGWVRHEWVDAHTSGYEEFAAFVRDYTPERCAEPSGIAADEIRALAALIGKGRAVSFWWTMGVNQGHESTRVTQAMINLSLLTANIGRPGTGANSITGQCNAMGSRLYGNATSLLGGRPFGDAAGRARVADVLQIPPESIPAENSLAYDQIIDGIETGEIRGLWVIATNPAHSWIDHGRVKRLREKLEFLVVQDMYASTETALMADLVLPAAGWGEKEGTFINAERRLSVLRKVARAPGQALTDFAIFKLIAEAWGCGEMFRAWSSPEATFQIIKRLSEGQPCDITGMRDYAHIEACGGIQWPYSAAEAAATDEGLAARSGWALRNPRWSAQQDGGADASTASAVAEVTELDAGRPKVAPRPDDWRERRLFADGRFFTPDERARFLFDAPQPPPERPDDEYPFWLNTGRGSSAQWHTGTRTDKSDVLRKLAPTELWCEIHPDDAARLGVAAGERVHVRSRRGSVEAVAYVTATVTPGQVFLPMHFDGVNVLTYPAFDPHSRQPSYKACSVKVEPIVRKKA